jgi:hypothetical protein
MKDQPIKVIVHQEWYEFVVLVPSVDLAANNAEYEYVVELPVSVIEDYKAEINAIAAALSAAEAKFQAYLKDNDIRWK